ncbi:MAG: flavodoxin [Clostridia bacterium]|jgi:flavodoxin|nr:flavodoxin [Oscillospiraceae bacterium]
MKKINSVLMCVAACAAMSGCSSETQTDTQNSIPEPAEAVTGEASADSTETSADEIQTENADGDVSEAETLADESDEQTTSGGTAVVYFSATGNTADIAEKVANILNADKFEIIPEEPYTPDDLNYNDDNCRANLEMNDDSARPAISGDMTALTEYDTVFIGYPIWWGTAPRIIDTLFESYDMSGKTVYTFCTSGGNGIGQSIDDLTSLCPDVTISDGRRFNAEATEDDVRQWMNGLDS